MPSKKRPQPATYQFHSRHKKTEEEEEEEQTPREERVTSKHSPLVPVLEEIAYTILRVARCVQRLDSNAVADLPRLAVGWRLGDGLAVLAANHAQWAQGFELVLSLTFRL